MEEKSPELEGLGYPFTGERRACRTDPKNLRLSIGDLAGESGFRWDRGGDSMRVIWKQWEVKAKYDLFQC